jgi:hypothetical protein
MAYALCFASLFVLGRMAYAPTGCGFNLANLQNPVKIPVQTIRTDAQV